MLRRKSRRGRRFAQIEEGAAGSRPARLGGRTGRAAIAVAVAAGIAPSTLVAPAQAGTFTVSQCNRIDQPSWAPAGFDAAAWTHSGVAAQHSGCAGDGSEHRVSFAERRLYADEIADTWITLPADMPGTTLSGFALAHFAPQQSASTNPARFSVWASSTKVVDHDVLGSASSSQQTYQAPTGSRYMRFSMWCTRVNGPGYCNWSGDAYSIRGLTLNLEENTVPSVDAGGALLSGGAQAGIRSLEVTGDDSDSGIAKLAVTLDGRSVGTLDFAAQCRTDRFRPCPAHVSQTIDVDTTQVPDGDRALRVVATDLAGNEKRLDKGLVTVANAAPANVGAPPADGGTPGTTGPTTTVNPVHGTVPNGSNHSVKAVTRFKGSRIRDVRHGASTTIRGRLTDESGRGIGGATIAVSQRKLIPDAGFAEGSAMTPLGTLVTEADGSFSYTARAGASRSIQFAYKAFKDAGEFAWTTDVRLLVAGRVTLKASRASVRNGQSVTFSGRIAGPVPAAGVPVVLQASTSRGWISFKTTRAKRNGTFRATYRFTSTRTTTSYRFRARAMGDSGYAFKPATARSITVRVRGR